MRRLLCRLGIHTPSWAIEVLDGAPDLGWIQLRRCAHCHCLLVR